MDLANIYYKGQEKIWDGRTILENLFLKHGEFSLKINNADSMLKIIDLLIAGEYVAWNIAASFSEEITDVGAKLAATSQAHDEGRHATVLESYRRKFIEVNKLNYTELIPTISTKFLNKVRVQNSIAKKMLGNLIIESVAMSIIHLIRLKNAEPVLCNLLTYIGIDEARHLSFSISYLPVKLKELSSPQLLDLWIWQLKMLNLEIDAVCELSEDFEKLGFPIREVLKLGEQKQLAATQEMLNEFGLSEKIPVIKLMKKLIELKINNSVLK